MDRVQKREEVKKLVRCISELETELAEKNHALEKLLDIRHVQELVSVKHSDGRVEEVVADSILLSTVSSENFKRDEKRRYQKEWRRKNLKKLRAKKRGKKISEAQKKRWAALPKEEYDRRIARLLACNPRIKTKPLAAL